MVHKLREACLWPLEVCKRHHRRGRRGIATKKHWELVDEVANRRLAGLLPTINLRGKEVSWDLQLVAEIAHLFRLGFEVLGLWVRQHKIEDSDASLNVFEFVFPAVAKILPADLAVQPAREDVIDLPVHWEVFGARVFLRVQLVPEGGRPLAPMATGESEELACPKVAGMGGYDVKKVSFGLAVTQGLQRFEVRRFDARKDRIWFSRDKGARCVRRES